MNKKEGIFKLLIYFPFDIVFDSLNDGLLSLKNKYQKLLVFKNQTSLGSSQAG
jgi:hypothetical protein